MMPSIRDCLRNYLSLSLITTISGQPLMASEIILNHITSQRIQYISPQTGHPGQFVLQLSPELWQLQDQENIILMDGENLVGVFYGSGKQGPLVFKTFEEQPHFHFYPNETEQVTHGDLQVNTKGRLSLHTGTYTGHTRLIAKRIYLNKSQDNQKTIFMGSLMLNAQKEIRNRSPLRLHGHFGLRAPIFNNTADIQGKGKGIFQIDQGKNRSTLRFNNDVTLSGYDKNTPFLPFSSFRNLLLATKTNLIIHGRDYEQTKQGRTFAAIALQANLDTLKGDGHFLSSMLSFQANKGMSFHNALLQGNTLCLQSSLFQTSDQSLFRVQHGMTINAESITGTGRFEIGATSAWAFPYHLFYDNAAPKSNRALQLKMKTLTYLAKHASANTPLFGCHLQTKALDLDDRTTFDILGGSTRIKTLYGHIRGKIRQGSFNDQVLSINAHELSFLGELAAIQSNISAHLSHLDGDFTVKHFDLAVDDLTLPGRIHSDHLTSIGKTFQLASKGIITTRQSIDLKQDQIVIDGMLTTHDLHTQSKVLLVSPTGHVSSNSAVTNNDHTQIDGTFTTSALSILGKSIHVPGILWASTITNFVPSWTLCGLANIYSFSSSIPFLSLTGGEDCTIHKATLSTDHTVLQGNMTLYDLTLSGKTLNIDKDTSITGNSWCINLIKHFMLGANLNLSRLTLSAPLWNQASNSKLFVDHVTCQVDGANLQGHVTGTYFQAYIKNLNLGGTLASDQVHLQGYHFNNTGGAINNKDIIDLNYNTYQLGTLITQGTIIVDLNDRIIHEGLLNYFEEQFGYTTLSLRTKHHLRFSKNLVLHKNLALSAPSLVFDHLALGKWQSWRDLTLESREHPLILSNYEIITRNGTFLSGSDFLLNGSTIQTRKALFFVVNGNMILNRTARPSLLKAGQDGMEGSTGGKFIVNVSDLLSDGHIKLVAQEGFEFNAQEIHYEEHHTKRTHWGLGKKTTTYSYNRIIPSTITSRCLTTLISHNGGAHFDSTQIVSPENITVATKGAVTNLQRLTYDNTTTKKSTPWSRKYEEKKRQGDSPTIVTSLQGVTIISWNSHIHLPNTILMAPEIWIEALNDIHLKVPSLRPSYLYESSGWTLTNGLLELCNKGTCPDPLVRALQNLYNMHNDHPVNQMSAGITTGIKAVNTYNAYKKSLANGGTLMTFGLESLLSNLFQLQLGWHNTTLSCFDTTPGRGGIFSHQAKLYSHKGNIYTLNGFPLDVDHLTLSCPNGSWYREGFRRAYGSYFDTVSFSTSLSFDPTSFSFSASSSETEGIEWIPQLIRDPNPTLEIKSVICLDGPSSHHHSQWNFGISLGKNSFDLSINDYGISYAAPKEDVWGSVGFRTKQFNVVVPLAKTEPAPISTKPSFLQKEIIQPLQSPEVTPPPSEKKPTKASSIPTQKSPKSLPKEEVTPKELPSPPITAMPPPAPITLRKLIEIYPCATSSSLAHFQQDNLDKPLTQEEYNYYDAALSEDATDYVIAESAWEFYGQIVPTKFFTNNPVKIFIVDSIKESISFVMDKSEDPVEHLLAIHKSVSSLSSKYIEHLLHRLDMYYAPPETTIIFNPLPALPAPKSPLLLPSGKEVKLLPSAKENK